MHSISPSPLAAPIVPNDSEPVLNEALKADLASQIDFVMRNDAAVKSTLSDNPLHVGTPIPTYEYINDVLVPTEQTIYPVMSEGNIVFFATKTISDSGEEVMQLNQADDLAEKVNSLTSNGAALAFVYDAVGFYLMTEETAVVVSQFETPVAERSLFASAAEAFAVFQEQAGACNTVSVAEQLPEPNMQPRVSECILVIPYVSQAVSGYKSEICWAATTASIGEYVTGKSLSATDIAKTGYYLATGSQPTSVSQWNVGRTASESMRAMQYMYGFSYPVLRDAVYCDTYVYKSLAAGYPVYADWRFNNGDVGHASVIRGIDSNSRVYVMEPSYGFSVANKNSNGRYSYVAISTGVTLTSYGVMGKE